MTSVSMWRIGHTSPLNCDFKSAEAHRECAASRSPRTPPHRYASGFPTRTGCLGPFRCPRHPTSRTAQRRAAPAAIRRPVRVLQRTETRTCLQNPQVTDLPDEAMAPRPQPVYSATGTRCAALLQMPGTRCAAPLQMPGTRCAAPLQMPGTRLGGHLTMRTTRSPSTGTGAQYPVRNAPLLALRSLSPGRAGLLRNSRSLRCAASPNLRSAQCATSTGSCGALRSRRPHPGHRSHCAPGRAGRLNRSAQLLTDHKPVAAQCRSAEADPLQPKRILTPGPGVRPGQQRPTGLRLGRRPVRMPTGQPVGSAGRPASRGADPLVRARGPFQARRSGSCPPVMAGCPSTHALKRAVGRTKGA